MSVSKFNELMNRAHAIPYRVGGRVRVAYTDGTPALAVEKMEKAVRTMAGQIAERLAEPDRDTKVRWDKAGLTQLDVCDEPCPDGVSLVDCPVAWLVERASRYHVRFYVTPEGKIGHEGVDGWQAADRKVEWKGQERVISGYLSVMPTWYIDAINRRKAEVIAHLAQTGATK